MRDASWRRRNVRLLEGCGQLWRQWMGGGFFVPEDADDPPASAVVKELDGVDAAGEGLVGGSGAGLVAAEDLGDVSELFDTIDDRVFEEAVGLEIAACTLGIALDIFEENRAVFILLGGGEARTGDKEGTEA